MRPQPLDALAFTYAADAVLLCGWWTGWAHVRAVGTCMICGALASFSAAPLCDRTVYARMRASRELSRTAFYAGHVLVHVAPLLGAWGGRGGKATIAHGVCAAALHLAWARAVAGGWALDAVYVPLRYADWCRLWLVALTTEVALGPRVVDWLAAR